MKKIIFIIGIPLLLFSCEKNIAIESGDSEMEEGNLTVNVFEVAHTPFAKYTRTALNEAMTRLNFAVYDEEGERVRQVNQTSDKDPFGKASFQLEAGKYLLTVVGHSSKGNPTMTNPAKIQFTNATGYTDTFLFSSDITIGDEQVNMDISLSRIVALCRFVITDDIPKDVAMMKFYYTGGSGSFDANTGLGSVNSKQTVTIDVKDGTKQFDLYTILHSTEGNISLKVSALDADENVLLEREFDVPMYQNQITWLSGAFFTGSGSSAASIGSVTVDAKWAGEHYVTF